MAQRVSVELIDDLDGSPASETVRFGLDGVNYEIDLNGYHANDLRQTIERWKNAARRQTRHVSKTDGRRGPRQPLDYDPAAVRAWAGSRNIPVSVRGRISADV
ncbi:MAG: Lsr2 family protein, partial [Bifidobacteriaceae bacterium]|nr:Lsr2 family protein [Bifidobacteriaceae bacterium]